MDVTDLYRLVWLSRPLMQRAEALVEQSLRDTGLSVRMRAVLEILLRFGALSVPAIAERLEIQRQYVQLMVNDVIAAGYAEKRPNSRHKSSPLIALTDTGRNTITRVMDREQAVMRAMSAAFDPQEVETALDVTERLMVLMEVKLKGDTS